MEDHLNQQGSGLTCKFRQYHSLNYSRQETTINVLLVFSVLFLIAIEQQSLKPQHILKVWAVLLHEEDTKLPAAVIQIIYTFTAQTVFGTQKME